jgi:hypothetical protein
MCCVSCESMNTKVIESRVCLNGTRRQRVWCRDCEHRWTVWRGEQPSPGRVPYAQGGNGGNKPALSEDDVRLVLTSELSSRQLGRQLGRSKEAIAAIRRGTIHQNTCPEIPRWKVQRGGPSCQDCQHWVGERCGMGFPDPIEEGPGFAADCSLFVIQ